MPRPPAEPARSARDGRRHAACVSLRQNLSFLAASGAPPGVQRADPIIVLGLSVRRVVATAFAGVLYSVIAVAVLRHLLALAYIVEAVSADSFQRALGRLSLSSGMANPYAYMAIESPSRLLSWFGIAYISLAWWLCSASVLALGEGSSTRELVIYAALRGIGFVWLMAVFRLHDVARRRCGVGCQSTLNRMRYWRETVSSDYLLLEVIGVVFAMITVALIRK